MEADLQLQHSSCFNVLSFIKILRNNFLWQNLLSNEIGINVFCLTLSDNCLDVLAMTTFSQNINILIKILL